MSNSDAIETFEYRGFRGELHSCTDAPSPRLEFDHLGVMACWHRRYTLGDKIKNKPESPYEYERRLPKGTIIIPIYMYDHSGLTVSSSPFSCPWDSGQVGIITLTPEQLIAEYGSDTPENREKAKSVLEAEIKEYDQYLRGDVYDYVVYDPDGDVVDSLSEVYECEYATKEMEDATKREADKYWAERQQTVEESVGVQD